MALVAFFISAFISASAIPWIILYAHKRNLFDSHDERKIHSGNIPRLGGVGIVFSFLVTIAIMTIFGGAFIEGQAYILEIVPILISGFLVFLLGLVDDIRGVRAIVKLIVQILVAVGVMAAGFVFRIVSVPWGNHHLDLGLFSYPLTLFWIIGITNSINLIDGMDGLAGGVVFISSFAFALFALEGKNNLSAEICFAIMGSSAGFLLYNLPPAKIFMGDAGSLFLGFMMALLPLLGERIEGVGVGLASSVLILSIPIFDTLMAIYRRKRAGVSFFTADKGHLHHKLLDRGFTCPRSLLIIYGISGALGIAALSSFFLPLGWSMAVKSIALAGIFTFFAIINSKNNQLSALSAEVAFKEYKSTTKESS